MLGYTVTATNTGDVTLHNVTVSDALTQPSSKTCATLAPGATCVLDGNYTVLQSDMDAGDINNTGSATSTEVPTKESNVSTPVGGMIVDADENITIQEDSNTSGSLFDNLTDNDSNSHSITSATVDIDGDGNDDLLALGTPTQLFDSNGTLIGILTVDSNGSYSFAPAPNYNGIVPTVTYDLVDDNDPSDTDRSTLDIIVTPTTDAISDGDENVTTPEDTNVSGDLFANLTDNDSNSHAVTTFTVDGNTYPVSAGGSQTAYLLEGELTIDSNGTYSFAPAPNYNGPVPHVTYTVVDNNDPNDTDTSTLDITVAPTTDAISDGDENVTTSEDTNISGDLFANLTDSDSSDHNITEFTVNGTTYTVPVGGSETVNLAEGTLTIDSNGSYSFVPVPNYNGSVPHVTYTVVDNNDPNDTDTSILSITVTPLNDTPVANDDNTSTSPGTPVDIAVLGNDSDPDGDILTVTIDTNASHGTVSVDSNGTVTYTPNTGFSGIDTFTYTVSDGHGGTDTATVRVTVTSAPVVPPTANDDILIVLSGNGSESIDVTANDQNGTYPIDPSTVSLIPPSGAINIVHDGSGDVIGFGIPNEGQWSVDQNGTATFTPNAGYIGDPTAVDYNISDTMGNTATAQVKIDYPPKANDDINNSVQQGDSVTFDPVVNDQHTSIALDPSTVRLVIPTSISAINIVTDGNNEITSFEVPGEGRWSVDQNGTVTFDPDPSLTGNPTPIEYTVKEHGLGTNNRSNKALLRVSYINAAVLPIAFDDHSLVVSHYGANPGSVIDNDQLGTGTLADHTWTLVSQPDHGRIEFNSDGTFIYYPDPNYSGQDSFTYMITDGAGNTSIATAYIDVVCASTQTSDSGDSLGWISICILMFMTMIFRWRAIRYESLQYTNLK